MVENQNYVNIYEVVKTVAQGLIEKRKHEYRFNFCIHDIIEQVKDETGIKLTYMTVKHILESENIDITKKEENRPTFFHKKEEKKEENK